MESKQTARAASPDNLAGEGHRTANRVLDILEILAESRQGLALRDLSRDLSAPKSSLLPLLRTLTGRGYLTHNDVGIYKLGAKILQLGSGALAATDLRDIAHPTLLALSTRTGESTILATLTSDNSAVLYIDKVEGMHRLRVASSVGDLRPLHSTSSGKVLLAFMPAAQREAVIKGIKLTRITAATITSKAQLREEISRAQVEGVSINVDQSVMGQCAIAAPIFNHQGEAVAACVISAAKDRVKDNIPRLIEDVKVAAGSISRLLGYRVRITR